jgi:hypothetical protein
MQTAERFNRLDPWSQKQMIGIGQDYGSPAFFELLWYDSLYSTGSADRHKSRRLNLAVCRAQQTASSGRVGILMENFEVTHFNL